MEKSTTLILAAIGLGGLGFFLYKKGLLGKKSDTTSTSPIAVAPISTNTTTTTTTKVVAPITKTSFEYPYGLKEGDYVKFGTADAVYLLVNGERRHISYNWMMANDQKYWDKVKFLDSYQALNIPEGKLLDV